MIDNLKKFLNEDQDPNAIEKVADKIYGILMNGEEIEYIAVQKKPAVNFSPDCVALTNKRVIFCRPKNFGLSMDFQDFLWKDVLDCHIKEGMLGSEFMLKTVKGKFFTMDYLPKSQARKLYTVAQEQEEIQREYRRQRELEEIRAGAGNVNVNAGPTSAPVQAPQAEDPIATLQKLKTLLDNGLITQAEFDTKKQEVLARM